MYKYKCDVDAIPTVWFTSIEANSILFSVSNTSFGGIICVIYPTSSWENASSLNPVEVSALAPKLELELVTEISPPDSVTNCSENPVAKTVSA